MASSIRCLSNLRCRFFNKILIPYTFTNQVRTLLTAETLGLSSYESSRVIYKNKLFNLEEVFRNKMQSYVNENPNSIIFTEDLKTMINIVEDTPEDFDLMEKMIRKFISRNESMRFGTYNFGPIIMRALYKHNNHELAFNLFQDPETTGLFTQVSSYHILLDLLYNNQKYADMRSVYDHIKIKFTDGNMHPRKCLVMVFASCYRENTPESFKYACDLWQELSQRGSKQVRRNRAYLAALALKQKQPDVAIELLTGEGSTRYISLRCQLIHAYIDLDRFDNIIPFLRDTIYKPTGYVKEVYFKDTIDKMEKAIKDKNVHPDAEISILFKIIKKNHTLSYTIDDYFDIEIKDKQIIPRKGDEQVEHRREQVQVHKQSNVYERQYSGRLGIRDLD